jgi:hypothetical protein
MALGIPFQFHDARTEPTAHSPQPTARVVEDGYRLAGEPQTPARLPRYPPKNSMIRSKARRSCQRN